MTFPQSRPQLPPRKEELPVDRGWAWIICIAVFLNHFYISNSMQVLAVTFVDIVVEFDASFTTVSLVLMVKTLCMSVSSIVSVNYLVPRFGVRKVLTLSALVFCVCGIGYSFTPSIGAFIALATVRGITIGIINLPAVNLLGFYFKKHRSIATTIAVCGASVSALSWPRFVRFIVSLYGLRGTLLLNGALEGQMIWVAMLLRPVLSYRSPNPESENDASFENCSTTKHDCNENNSKSPTSALHSVQYSITSKQHNGGGEYFDDIKHQDKKNNSHDPANNSTPLLEEYKQKPTDNDHENSNEEPTVYITNPNHLSNATEISVRSIVEKSIMFKSSPDVFASLDDNNKCGKDSDRKSSQTPPRSCYPNGQSPPSYNVCKIKDGPFDYTLQNKSSSTSCLDTRLLGRQIRYTSVSNLGSALELGPSVLFVEAEPGDKRMTAEVKDSVTVWQKIHFLFDFSLFKQWAFLWMLLSAVPCGTNPFVFTFLPTVAYLKGVSKDGGAILLTIVGGIELVSRLVMGLVADTKYFRVSTIIGVCCVVLGSIFLFVELCNDFLSLIFMSVAIGMFVGIRSSLITVLFIDVFGLEKMAKAFSMFTVLITLSRSGHSPLFGYMMENVGANSAMYYVGAAMILGGLIIYTLPLVMRLENAWKGRRSDR